MEENNSDNKDQSASLESTSTPSTTPTEENSLEGASSPEPTTTTEVKKKSGNPVLNIIRRVNIYVLLFIFILVLAGGMVLVGIQRNKKAAVQTTINTQTLSADELKQLTENEQKVGDPKSTLSIESNAIFSGKVLVRDSLDVAGTIKVGGSLNLPGINVSGTSSFDQITANSLNIAGTVGIQGQLNIQKGITSTGGATFGGPISAPQLTVQSLQLSGDLQIIRHIDAGGGTPGKSDGNSLGSGGTASISGSDTAGTVSINTGGGPGAGCFVTVNFTQKFSGNPHVVITPVGSAAASLNYYINNRSSSGFSICTANVPGGGQSFSFDYVVID